MLDAPKEIMKAAKRVELTDLLQKVVGTVGSLVEKWVVNRVVSKDGYLDSWMVYEKVACSVAWLVVCLVSKWIEGTACELVVWSGLCRADLTAFWKVKILAYCLVAL